MTDLRSIDDQPLDTPAAPGHLRLLTYNIQVGINTSRYRHYLTHSWKHLLPSVQRERNLERIARFIKSFDIVGLQELDAGSLRSLYVDQAELLARNSGLDYWYTRINRRLGALAQHSQAVLTRYPALSATEHRLPTRVPGRGALEISLGNELMSLQIIQVHLSLSRNVRHRQLEYIAELVKQKRYSVVMGDFNAPPDSPEIRAFQQATGLVAPEAEDRHTYPSWRPVHRLDHILFSPELQVLESHVYTLNYSDHLPVGVDLILPPDLCQAICGEAPQLQQQA
ncbi:MAG: endonuclease/exonuclease/phosphatase family protein [Gammaproteobacteria bacterium]